MPKPRRSGGILEELANSLGQVVEGINGDGGILMQMRVQSAKLASVELIIAGGIDAGTGEVKKGLSQKLDENGAKLDGHLVNHQAAELKQSKSKSRKEWTLWSTLLTIVSLFVVQLLVDWYHLFR